MTKPDTLRATLRAIAWQLRCVDARAGASTAFHDPHGYVWHWEYLPSRAGPLQLVRMNTDTLQVERFGLNDRIAVLRGAEYGLDALAKLAQDLYADATYEVADAAPLVAKAQEILAALAGTGERGSPPADDAREDVKVAQEALDRHRLDGSAAERRPLYDLVQYDGRWWLQQAYSRTSARPGEHVDALHPSGEMFVMILGRERAVARYYIGGPLHYFGTEPKDRERLAALGVIAPVYAEPQR